MSHVFPDRFEFRASICPYGCVHMEIGDVTYRLHPHEFVRVARAFMNAAARIGEDVGVEAGSAPNRYVSDTRTERSF